ncbi:histidine phosphatase family protein [Streptomyces acidicola]|uniref:histidine phosphatase family protein n=1 Tax=Streptomyces acidicola TaxID=2596892 RepID=UPI00379D12B1
MHLRVTFVAAARSASLLAERFEDDRPLDQAGWNEVQRAAHELLPLAAAELRYRTLAQCPTLQGGGVGHPARSGPEGRSGMAKIALSDNGVVGPTAGRAGSQACGGRVRPTFTGRRWPVKQEPMVVPRSGTDRNHLPSGRRGRQCSPTPRSRATGDALGFAPLAQPALRDCDVGRWRGSTVTGRSGRWNLRLD